MAFTNVYDDTFPADTELANLIGANLRQVRLDVQQRMAAISGLDAAKPNFAGDAQPANWTGILFFATDTGKVYQFNGATWTDVTASVNAGRMFGLSLSSGSPLFVGASTTLNFGLFSAVGGTVAAVGDAVPIAGSIKSIYVQTSTAQPGTGTLQVAIAIAGTPILTLTIAAGAAAGVYSTTGVATFSAGNIMNWQLINGALTTSASIQSMLASY